ncbi:MAG: DUF1573 domain-containing protein [bacterium]
MRWTSHSYFRPAAALLCILSVWGGSTVRSADDVADEVGTIVWDFGYVPQKAEVSHTFYLHNDSDAPLNVSKIKAGCSCTSTSEINEPIAPGDSAAIEVTFKSGRYKGTVTKTTKVYTDENEAETFRLAIKANVVKNLADAQPIAIEPMHLKAYARDDQVRLAVDTIVVTNSGADSVTVDVLAASAGLELDRLPKIVGPGSRVGIPVGVRAVPSDDSDWLSATLLVIGRDTTRVTIPVQIER